MGDAPLPPLAAETSSQSGNRGRRRPRRARGGSGLGYNNPTERTPEVGSSSGGPQRATEGVDASEAPPSQNSQRGRYVRGRGRGNMSMNAAEGPRHEDFRPPFVDVQPQAEPQRRGGRGNRGYPRYGGRGANSSMPASNNSVFNPYAPPFVPVFAGPPVDMLGDGPVRAHWNQRRGSQTSTSGQMPREFRRLAPERPFGPPPRQQDNPYDQSVRGKSDSRGPARGGNPRIRRKPLRKIRSGEGSDQEMAMRERLINQLEDNRYECAICCQVVLAKQGIWSCKTCYHMFHISGGCIVNWAKKSKEDDNKWRCPTCQTKYEAVPYNYFCFCGKQRNPLVTVGETPHSCGNVCGGRRALTCPHPCNEPCHPGPCPECPVMLTKRCNCGNVQKAVRCGSVMEVKCDKVCDRLLECGKHRCARVCHEGACNPCDITITQTCFCGTSSREVICSEKGDSEKYSCGSACTGMYNCGVHQCTRSCHPTGESGCGPCPSAPERITHCPCGRCSLEDLGIKRKTCEDPIPTCRNVCSKVLECGSGERRHRCRALCHTGECPPCDLTTSVICRCKQVKRTLPCAEYVQFTMDGNEFLCEKRCKKRKSCGIHKCQERCCVQTEHFCLQLCNKRLSCGLHFCESICHAGLCSRCLNSSFEEQYCHCGRTVRPPPVPCGAPLPECREPCARPHACNHPVTHHCHGEERCPPCTALTEKMCYGKHELRKNIPCHIEAVSCGRLCNKPLSCGVHNCARNCHAGECMRENEKCTKPCMILRRPCEHPCSLPCHGLQPCPESECRHPINVTCECGKRRSTLKCVEFDKISARLRAVEAEESEGDQSNESNGVGKLKRSASMEKLNCLPCDDDCKKVARNKKLAEALQLVTDENGMLEREPTITFTEYMKTELRTNAAFVTEVEKTFLDLLDKIGDPTFLGPSLNYNFRPMSVDKRRFIHEYAAFFSIDTAGVDDPPKRSVIATAKRATSRAPLVLLTSLQKYPNMLKTAGSVTLKSSFNDEKRSKEPSTTEDAGSGSSMKTLRGSRMVKRRVAPVIARPSPLPQFNHFAALCSDDEDTGPAAAAAAQTSKPKPTTDTAEKDPNWWSDEEEMNMTEEEECAKIASLLEDLVQKVCRLESGEDASESCKDSWSDED